MNIKKANKILKSLNTSLILIKDKSDYFYFISDEPYNVPESIYTNSIKNITKEDLIDAVNKFNKIKEETNLIFNGTLKINLR